MLYQKKLIIKYIMFLDSESKNVMNCFMRFLKIISCNLSLIAHSILNFNNLDFQLFFFYIFSFNILFIKLNLVILKTLFIIYIFIINYF